MPVSLLNCTIAHVAKFRRPLTEPALAFCLLFSWCGLVRESIDCAASHIRCFRGLASPREAVFRRRPLFGFHGEPQLDQPAELTADGKTRDFWERNLRFKTDVSDNGPQSGAPAIVGAGMVGDRADVIFSSPDEITGLSAIVVEATALRRTS